jgi:hypothetical protein
MAKRFPSQVSNQHIGTSQEPAPGTHDSDDQNTGSDGYDQGSATPHKAKGRTTAPKAGAPANREHESYSKPEPRPRQIASTTPEAGARLGSGAIRTERVTGLTSMTFPVRMARTISPTICATGRPCGTCTRKQAATCFQRAIGC